MDAAGELALERGRGWAVGPGLAGRVHLDGEPPALHEVVQEGGVGRRPADQVGRAGRGLPDGQARRAVPLGLGEHVRQRGGRARGAVGRDPAGARDAVGGREADAEHARQLVGLVAHDAVRARAVVGVDARHEPGQPVGREQQVQAARGAQRVPRRRRRGRLAGAQAGLLERPARIGVDDVEHALAVHLVQAGGADAADPLDPLQVGDQRGRPARGDGLGPLHTHLQPEAPVVLPAAGDRHALARLQVAQVADEDDVVAVAVGLHDGEAGVGRGEADAVDGDLVLEARTGLAVRHVGTLVAGRPELAPFSRPGHTIVPPAG